MKIISALCNIVMSFTHTQTLNVCFEHQLRIAIDIWWDFQVRVDFHQVFVKTEEMAADMRSVWAQTVN